MIPRVASKSSKVIAPRKHCSIGNSHAQELLPNKEGVNVVYFGKEATIGDAFSWVPFNVEHTCVLGERSASDFTILYQHVSTMSDVDRGEHAVTSYREIKKSQSIFLLDFERF